MAGTPAAPPPPDRPQPAGGADPNGQPATSERYGTVEIQRHVKDDGRALLLYTRLPGDAA